MTGLSMSSSFAQGSLLDLPGVSDGASLYASVSVLLDEVTDTVHSKSIVHCGKQLVTALRTAYLFV